MFNQGTFAEISAAIMKACVYADSAYWKLQHVEVLVAHLQATFDIQNCWKIGGPKYNHWKEEENIVKYKAAIDKLEHLVVMHLFKLGKLGMLGTGM